MGPEVARDEIVQAESIGEALHTWVKVGGHRMWQLLLREYSAGKEEGKALLSWAAWDLLTQPTGGGGR